MKSADTIHGRVSRYAVRGQDVLFQELGLSSAGYSEEEARASRERFGENVVVAQRADTVFFRLRRAFVNPFTVILFILAAITFLTDRLLGAGAPGNGAQVGIIAAMLLLSGTVRFVQELRAKTIAGRLTDLVDGTVMTLREGRWRELGPEELAVGDRVRLKAGDRVPADLRVIAARELFVSQSAVTGESAVTEKTEAPVPEFAVDGHTPGSRYTNILFMGTAVVGGECEGIVLAVGKETAYGEILGLEAGRKRGFDRGANSIAWVLIRFMAVLVPIVFVVSGLTKGDWLSAFLFALAVAVGLTPELLPMVVNACLVRGGAAMERKETVVKNVNAMQGFGSMDVLCVDKTGTLTGDEVILEYYMDILGNEDGSVLDMAFLNSRYHTGIGNHLDGAVLRCLKMPGRENHFAGLERERPKLDELPFDYERRLVSVLVGGGEENLLVVKGSVEAVCRRCRYVWYRGEKREIEGERREGVHAVVDELLEDGMKVLAVAFKTMGRQTSCQAGDESELVLAGYLAFFDAPKKSAASAIKKLRALSVDIKVLTGDQEAVALSVCRRLGMEAQQVFTGAQLEALSEEEFAVRVEETAIFAELSPRQKARIVRTLQGNGHTVGFLGDGMNDLPAVIEADVGISVDSGVEAVRESADVILLKKDLNVLEQGILEGRKAFANMSKYIKVTASSNFGNICSIVVAGALLPFLPMASIQLLLLNLLYDILCLVLPWDRVDEEIYRLPREWSGRTLGRFMCFFGPISSLFDLLTFAFLYFILCPAVCGAPYASLAEPALQARFVSLFQTGWFLESMWTQVMILQLLRTKRLPILESRPSGAVLAVTGAGVLLFTWLVFTPLGGLLGLSALPAPYFAFLAVTVVVYLLAVTAAKAYFVRRYRELI